MPAEQHVAAHVEQGMLGTEARLDLAEGIFTDALQHLAALGDLFLRWIFPSFAADAAGTIEIQIEVLGIAHHEGIALLLGELDDIVGVEPVPIVW